MAENEFLQISPKVEENPPFVNSLNQPLHSQLLSPHKYDTQSRRSSQLPQDDQDQNDKQQTPIKKSRQKDETLHEPKEESTPIKKSRQKQQDDETLHQAKEQIPIKKSRQKQADDESLHDAKSEKESILIKKSHQKFPDDESLDEEKQEKAQTPKKKPRRKQIDDETLHETKQEQQQTPNKKINQKYLKDEMVLEPMEDMYQDPRKSLIRSEIERQKALQKGVVKRKASIKQELSQEELKNEYFKRLQKSIADANSGLASQEICQDVVGDIEKMILEEKCLISEEQKDANALVVDSQITAAEVFEKNIKETRLKENKKLKEQLEYKLRYLSEDISLIEHEIDTSVVGKKNRFSVVKEISEEEKNSKEEQIRAIARERKELEKKRLARIEEMEMKELLEKEVAIEIKKEEKMRKEFERSLELRRKLEEQKIYQQNRDEQFRIEREKLKQVLLSKPLFEKLRERSVKEESIMLEEKKKTLAVIRELHQPLSVSNIKEHSKRVTEELKNMKEKSLAAASASLFKYKKPYVSEAYKKICKEKQNTVQELIEEKRKHKQVQEKIKEFESNVIKNTEIKVDPLKQSEMQTVIESIEHKPDFHWFREKKRPKINALGINGQNKKEQDQIKEETKPNKEEKQSDTKHSRTKSEKTHNLPENDSLSRKLGKDYLSFLRTERAKSQAIKTASSNMMTQEDKDPGKLNKSQEGLNIQNTSLPAIKPNKSLNVSSKIDYLKELKAEHEFKRSQTPEWKKYLLKNPTVKTVDKAQFILSQAQKLESNAERKLQLSKVKNGNKNNHIHADEVDNEIVDNFIDAIKAKFAFIEQAQSELF